MEREILVKQSDKGFQAAALGLPMAVIEAPTREEAISKAQAQAQKLFADGEIVKFNEDFTAHSHADIAGLFADVDAETWQRFQAHLQAYRAEIDADPNVP